MYECLCLNRFPVLLPIIKNNQQAVSPLVVNLPTLLSFPIHQHLINFNRVVLLTSTKQKILSMCWCVLSVLNLHLEVVKSKPL